MSPEAAKAIAREFFLAGFRCSGYRAHGEVRAIATSKAFERLLLVEFERAWGERALADEQKTPRVPSPQATASAQAAPGSSGASPRKRSKTNG